VEITYSSGGSHMVANVGGQAHIGQLRSSNRSIMLN
jgi:hypothetical protein